MLKTNKSMRNPYTALAAGLALSGLLVAGSAGAVTTATDNLTVTVLVEDNCTIVTSVLDFGSYDPAGVNFAASLAGTGGVSVTCTTGATATITLGQGANADTVGGSTDAIPLRRMKTAVGNNFLAYTLHTSLGGAVWGNTALTGVGATANGAPDDHTVFGTVAGAQNVPKGTYLDTVLATVTF